MLTSVLLLFVFASTVDTQQAASASRLQFEYLALGLSEGVFKARARAVREEGGKRRKKVEEKDELAGIRDDYVERD